LYLDNNLINTSLLTYYRVNFVPANIIVYEASNFEQKKARTIKRAIKHETLS